MNRDQIKQEIEKLIKKYADFEKTRSRKEMDSVSEANVRAGRGGDTGGRRMRTVLLALVTFQKLEECIELLKDRIDLELAIKKSRDLTDWDEFTKELRKETAQKQLNHTTSQRLSPARSNKYEDQS